MKSTYLYILVTAIILASCKKKQKFTQTPDGLQYCFIIKNDTAQKPHKGEALVVNMKFYLNDSLMFDTKDVSLNYKLELENPKIDGSIYEGLAMMHKGDSAIFKINALNFYQYTADMKPPSILKKGDKLTFYVRLIDILSPQEIKKEEERMKKLKLQNEQIMLRDYINNNNITTKPLKSGIYHIILKKGYGRKPKPGDSVTINYVGRFINNQIFESTLAKNKPFKFVYGDTNFIKGWNQAIGLMREGEEAQIIIPSKLAYGDKGISGIIPPFSTLIFDITILKIKKNKK
jgi:FKBP-type peptidyl-prolyl cis-trans isomerase